MDRDDLQCPQCGEWQEADPMEAEQSRTMTCVHCRFQFIATAFL